MSNVIYNGEIIRSSISQCKSSVPLLKGKDDLRSVLQINGSKFISALEFISACWKIPNDQCDILKSCFSAIRDYVFTDSSPCLFRLNGAADICQKLMNLI
ncbi:hypothetical protein RF11_09919 [Thelohanellus kitauei]|uniref:Uncharacterized protein n=1 Tax=Thelohanellus kitauei TaxID=669202 RepID=A0A0C2JQS7_THEKT|nr:hypothetical protein RF11_09919 [Thelohanellus kitauei]